MRYASILIEFIRLRPHAVFWLAALAQAALWVAVPALIYASPPGDVPQIVAAGHALRFNDFTVPPLPYWAADIAFTLAGNRIVGVYVLSQVCVVATYWAVFALGRATVGTMHAAIAVLLMAGVTALTIATPNFGPDVMAMPVWAFVILFYWRVIGERRYGYFFPMIGALILLQFITAITWVLIALIVLFAVFSPRTRERARAIDPFFAAAGLLLALAPSILWLSPDVQMISEPLARLRAADAGGGNMLAWLRLLGAILAGHAGLFLLTVLAGNLALTHRDPPPQIDRQPIDPFARRFIFFFALMPALTLTIVAVLAAHRGTFVASPLVVMSGLAIVAAGGDALRIHHQRIVSAVWFGLLLLPPLFAALAIYVVPWVFAAELRTTRPAREMGMFFEDSFLRRTGKPLPLIAGEGEWPALIALGATSRPRVALGNPPARDGALSDEDIKRDGAVVVWPATDLRGTPPPAIAARFPGLAIEPPRAFARPAQGRLEPLRMGWAMIRPAGDPSQNAPRTAPQ